MFDQVTRKKLRFAVANGTVTVEDLWSMKLTVLNDLAIGYHREIKEAQEESFITPHKKSTVELELKFGVVKHIIDTLLAEEKKAKSRAARSAETAKLKEIIAAKQDEAISKKSLKTLLAELESLLAEDRDD